MNRYVTLAGFLALVGTVGCTPYEVANAPCTYADRSGCGEVIPVNKNGLSPVAGQSTAVTTKGYPNIMAAVAAADRLEAAEAQSGQNLTINGEGETGVVIHDSEPTVPGGDAKLMALMEIQRAGVAAGREEMKGDLAAEIAAREQAEKERDAAALAAQNIVAELNALKEEMAAQKLALSSLAGDRSEPAPMAGPVLNDKMSKPAQELQLVSYDPADALASKQLPKPPTTVTAASPVETVSTPKNGDSIVDAELRRYKTTPSLPFAEALRNLEISQAARANLVKRAERENGEGPYSKWLQNQKPLMTVNQLRALYGLGPAAQATPAPRETRLADNDLPPIPTTKPTNR